VATILAFAASVAGLALPSSLLFLLLAVNVPTMMKYLGTCLAAYSVAANHPQVAAAARLRLAPGLVKALSVLGMIAAIAIATVGLGADVRPYELLAVWLGVGLAWYAWRKRVAERRP
jgi:APA family basic amino acid/polyamine antiporter